MPITAVLQAVKNHNLACTGISLGLELHPVQHAHCCPRGSTPLADVDRCCGSDIVVLTRQPLQCRQTSKRWHKILREQVSATRQMNLNHDESPIHEELNIAWAGPLGCLFCAPPPPPFCPSLCGLHGCWQSFTCCNPHVLPYCHQVHT